MILINGVLNLYCGLLGLLMLLADAKPRRHKSLATGIRRNLLMIAILMLLCDGTARCFFHRDPRYSMVYTVLTAFSFAFFYLADLVYTVYLIEVLELRKERTVRLLLWVNGVSCGLGLLMWCSNCFAPFFFNILSRQPTNALLYRLSILPGAIPVVTDLILLLCRARQMERYDMVLLMVEPLLPLISSVTGQLIPGLSLQYALILAGLVLNHFYFDEVLDRDLARKEQELETYRLRETLERVKPHYIYNVLTTIYYLCQKDPEQAQQAVGTFSDYLRQALRGMEAGEWQPFSKELSLIESYLKLEQLRFADRISVSYSIREQDFLLPPFTVQPLVENAVKHGMTGRRQLHIQIDTRRTEEGYVICVRDDGAGFSQGLADPEEPSGLRNIQALLEFEHAGSLQIDSVPGIGTAATVTIFMNSSGL